eukprot:2207163-Pleurochrysis_carterae.AAC.1
MPPPTHPCTTMPHHTPMPARSHCAMSGACTESATPPDLVMKRQQLAGLVAVHAADPSNASRAGMIAELRFDIQ